MLMYLPELALTVLCDHSWGIQQFDSQARIVPRCHRQRCAGQDGHGAADVRVNAYVREAARLDTEAALRVASADHSRGAADASCSDKVCVSHVWLQWQITSAALASHLMMCEARCACMLSDALSERCLHRQPT